MQDDVEQVARAIFESDGQSWSEVGTAWPWYLDAARAAMAATLELAADGLREQVVPRGATYEARLGVEVAADWLQQRANDVKETGNE